MTQLSRKPLKSEVREEILENLWLSLAAVSKKEEVLDFVDDLLTSTERLMLAKRLAIVILLMRGWKYEDIKKFLNVSGATIWAMRSKVERGGRGFRFILEYLEKKKSLSQILKKAEKSFGFMPPIVGRGRWAWLYRK